MPKIDLSNVPRKTGSIYPAPHDRAVAGRWSLRVGQAGGLTQFGANIVVMPPGTLSSLRHWHLNEDEFLMMIEGELVLIEDDGETPMRAGDCATFPAGKENGHHMVNRSDREARFLVIGTKAAFEEATYSDVDMKVRIEGGTALFTRRDGSPLPSEESEN